MKMRSLAAALLLCLGMAGGAEAQSTLVNPTCSTIVSLYPSGSRGQPMSVDQYGALCISGGSGGGLSVTDQAAWTQATSPFTPTGGVFNDTATLTSGQQGTVRLNTKRAMIIDTDTTGNNLYAAVTGPVPAGTNLIGKVGIDQTTPGTTNLVALTPAQAGAGATAAAVPANASYNGLNVGGNLVGQVGDPCQVTASTILPFTIPTATTTNILTGTAAQKIYVCYLYLQTGIANNVALIEGTTGATCGSGTAALVGGVTAATGLINAANSGQAFGNGGFSVLQTQTNNNDICVITSAAGPLSGVLKYVKR